MNQMLELPASLLHTLEQQAQASGTTPQGWIAARLAEAGSAGGAATETVHSQLDPPIEKLGQIGNHKDGWNRYSAPAPNREAVDRARRFWEVMKEEGQQPTRVAASAVGGVGITQRQ